MRSLVLCLMLANPVLAQDVPDLSYFEGRYEVVGRTEKGPFEDVLELTIKLGGGELYVKSCEVGPGIMVVDRSAEGRFASIAFGTFTVECQWFNTWDNYPLIACYDDGRTRLTLWPANEADGCAG
jgi:hypothetical protein